MSFILILFGSLLGSAHCAAMCGGFVSLCSQSSFGTRGQVFYHLGRLCTYLMLGSIAAIIGETVNHFGERYGVTDIATLITGTLLVGAGIVGLLRVRTSFAQAKIFIWSRAIQQKVLPDRSHVILYPLTIGLFSTFLPCGWLFSYVAIAAQRASLPESLAVMFVFWLGTVPVLALIGGVSRFLISPISRYMPLLASYILIAAGVFSIYSHLAHRHSTHSHSCVDRGTQQESDPTFGPQTPPE